jgi:hypothetical protein
MSLPPDDLAALERLSLDFAACSGMVGSDAVLVGGAATAIDTAGEFRTGDVDIVASRDEALDAALALCGFLKENRAGRRHIGFYHPDHLAFGFQQVPGSLFDGRAERGFGQVQAQTGEPDE